MRASSSLGASSLEGLDTLKFVSFSISTFHMVHFHHLRLLFSHQSFIWSEAKRLGIDEFLSLLVYLILAAKGTDVSTDVVRIAVRHLTVDLSTAELGTPSLGSLSRRHARAAKDGAEASLLRGVGRIVYI